LEVVDYDDAPSEFDCSSGDDDGDDDDAFLLDILNDMAR